MQQELLPRHHCLALVFWLRSMLIKAKPRSLNAIENRRRCKAQTTLHACIGTWFRWWRTEKLHCTPPTTSGLKQQGLKAMKIYWYRPGKRCRTKRNHWLPLEWQLHHTKRCISNTKVILSKDISPRMKTWSHKKWVRCEEVGCEQVTDHSQRVAGVVGQRSRHVVPQRAA